MRSADLSQPVTQSAAPRAGVLQHGETAASERPEGEGGSILAPSIFSGILTLIRLSTLNRDRKQIQIWSKRR